MQLKTLTKENADFVAAHLAMVSLLIESDPELAHQHAVSASRRGGRVGMVRETLAITAYQTGDFALALRELRTYRRISGNDDQLALMIDSERGLGRPDRGLELGRSIDLSTLPAQERVNVAIAMSGARLDQGQPELALAELEIEQLDDRRAFEYSPALFRAYAEVLNELGRDSEAQRWNALALRAEGALEAATHNEHETIEVVSEQLEGEELEAFLEEHGLNAPTDEMSEGADNVDPEAEKTDADSSNATSAETETSAVEDHAARSEGDSFDADADADADAEAEAEAEEVELVEAVGPDASAPDVVTDETVETPKVETVETEADLPQVEAEVAEAPVVEAPVAETTDAESSDSEPNVLDAKRREAVPEKSDGPTLFDL
ncbi:MAG: hypothetical protein ACTH31_09775 [Pseudoclavibacter sp.]